MSFVSDARSFSRVSWACGLVHAAFSSVAWVILLIPSLRHRPEDWQDRPGHIECLGLNKLGDTRCAPFGGFYSQLPIVWEMETLSKGDATAHCRSVTKARDIARSITHPVCAIQARPTLFQAAGDPFLRTLPEAPASRPPQKDRPHLAGNADRCIRGWNAGIIGWGGGAGKLGDEISWNREGCRSPWREGRAIGYGRT